MAAHENWDKRQGVGLKSPQSKEELSLLCTEGFIVLWQSSWSRHGFYRKGTVISGCVDTLSCSCEDRGHERKNQGKL